MPSRKEGDTVREFARSFYQSPAWKKTRAHIFQRDKGLCVRCGRPGAIVHHREPLTPENIDDVTITLNEENLELLCRECHGLEHATDLPTDKGLMFDEEGNLIPRPAVPAPNTR